MVVLHRFYCISSKDIFIFYYVISSDFFDAGVMPSASLSKDTETEEAKPSVIADVLPEGFFDDPKQDAKVSNSLSTSVFC